MRGGVLSDPSVQQNGSGQTQGCRQAHPEGAGCLHKSISFGQRNLSCIGIRRVSLNRVRYFHSSSYLTLLTIFSFNCCVFVM